MGAHLIDGEFQSDKYPTTPRGKVPLSVKDKAAQPLLWLYAEAHRLVDAEFSDDLQEALLAAGYVPANTRAARDVLAERERQGPVEGWTAEHDDGHTDGSMAFAAAAYAVASANGQGAGAAGDLWPWGADSWKPRGHRENLVRGAALILAEIDRVDRAGG